MTLFQSIALYPISFVIFLGVDMVWLGFIAKDLYQKNLGKFLSPDVNWLAAIIFYLLFVFGILIFAVFPGIREHSAKFVLLHSALFGLLSYATYDLTNLATIKGWPVKIVVIDMIWGMVLSSIVALGTYLIYNKIWG